MHILSDKLMFFVEEYQVATKLKKLGELETRDGPLVIIVRPSPPPRSSGGEDSGRGGGGERWSEGGGGGRWSRGGGGDQRQGRFYSRGGGRGGGGTRRFDGDEVMEEDAVQVVMVSECCVHLYSAPSVYVV